MRELGGGGNMQPYDFGPEDYGARAGGPENPERRGLMKKILIGGAAAGVVGGGFKLFDWLSGDKKPVAPALRMDAEIRNADNLAKTRAAEVKKESTDSEMKKLNTIYEKVPAGELTKEEDNLEKIADYYGEWQSRQTRLEEFNRNKTLAGHADKIGEMILKLTAKDNRTEREDQTLAELNRELDKFRDARARMEQDAQRGEADYHAAFGSLWARLSGRMVAKDKE